MCVCVWLQLCSSGELCPSLLAWLSACVLGADELCENGGFQPNPAHDWQPLKSLSTFSPPGGHGKTRTAKLDEALTLSIRLSLSVSDYTEGRGREGGEEKWDEQKKIEREETKIKKKRESDECEREWSEQEGINESKKKEGDEGRKLATSKKKKGGWWREKVRGGWRRE